MHAVALRVISSARLYLAVRASNPRYAAELGFWLSLSGWRAVKLSRCSDLCPLSRAGLGRRTPVGSPQGPPTRTWSQDGFAVDSNSGDPHRLLDPTPRNESWLRTGNVQHADRSSAQHRIPQEELHLLPSHLRDFAIQGPPPKLPPLSRGLHRALAPCSFPTWNSHVVPSAGEAGLESRHAATTLTAGRRYRIRPQAQSLSVIYPARVRFAYFSRGLRWNRTLSFCLQRLTSAVRQSTVETRCPDSSSSQGDHQHSSCFSSATRTSACNIQP